MGHGAAFCLPAPPMEPAVPWLLEAGSLGKLDARTARGPTELQHDPCAELLQRFNSFL